MDTDTAEGEKKETFRFQAEVSQVLHLVIHSLYSHREVFLRELVSNASDALDKLRFRALTDPSLRGEEDELAIRVIPDEEAMTLAIEDDGVGMTHDELVEHLGTIAHSGSKKFLEALKARGESGDLNLIGQFGVGFYSAWLVADRVEVTSRSAGSDTAWKWSSDASEGFTVEPAERASRGTTVLLHLRPEHKEFLDRWRIRELVRKYSDFVAHPIRVKKEADEAKEGDEWENANQARALWQRSKSEVTEEEYREFYERLTHDDDPPLAHTHFRVEAPQEFVGLLYIPSKPPFDLDVPGEKKHGVRLFVKRVFIMDDCDALLPQWLRFVRGVVDSDDLPLNVSRETLQEATVVKAIRKQVVKKTLDLMDEIAKDRPDDYLTLWTQFGRVIKEGLHIEWDQRERLGGLLRFESSRGEGLVSLGDYVDRMPEGQPSIYYALGERREALAESPHLEALRKRGWEVLLMTDVVDHWAVEALREFRGKKLVSVQQAELPMDEGDDAKKAREEKASALGSLFRRAEKVLGERVREVRVSDRLTDSPACLVVPPGGLNPTVERVLRAHGRDVPPVKRVLEMNPTHPLIEALNAKVEHAPDDPEVGEWIELLYDQALLTEGTAPENPQQFARRITALMTNALQK